MKTFRFQGSCHEVHLPTPHAPLRMETSVFGLLCLQHANILNIAPDDCAPREDRTDKE